MTEDEIIASLKLWCVSYTGNETSYFVAYSCSKLEFNLSTCDLVQSASEKDTIKTLCDASEIIWYAIFWFSTVTGIIGNLLAIITIFSLPNSTATFYIKLLAFSDLTAISVNLVNYYLQKNRVLDPSEVYWHILPLLFDFTATYSNWILVLICLERLITIRFPFQKRYYFTILHARISAIIMGVILLAIYNAATWSLGYQNLKMYTIRNLLCTVIPLFCILTLIALIALSIRKIHINRNALHERNSPTMNEDTRNLNANSEATPLGKKQKNPNLFTEIARMENSITIMMVVAAVVFALLTIPNVVHWFLFTYATDAWNTPVDRARWHIFTRTVHVLPFVNLAINFLLYFLSTKKFRSQLCKVFRCQTRQTPETSMRLTSANFSVTDNWRN